MPYEAQATSPKPQVAASCAALYMSLQSTTPHGGNHDEKGMTTHPLFVSVSLLGLHQDSNPQRGRPLLPARCPSMQNEPSHRLLPRTTAEAHFAVFIRHHLCSVQQLLSFRVPAARGLLALAKGCAATAFARRGRAGRCFSLLKVMRILERGVR